MAPPIVAVFSQHTGTTSIVTTALGQLRLDLEYGKLQRIWRGQQFARSFGGFLTQIRHRSAPHEESQKLTQSWSQHTFVMRLAVSQHLNRYDSRSV
jgi:hypothetical protein